jgi:long-subunit acyl-CoA synthetase (AMP-forming)
LTDRQVDLWLDKVNQSLPVYAQIHQWLRLQTPLSQADGTLTASGKPVRHKIAEQYQTEIDELYRERA